MKAVLVGALSLVVLVVAAVVVSGVVSPAEHVASVSATLDAPIEDVWRRISDVERYAAWRSDVEGLEVVGRPIGTLVGTTFRETGAEGPVLFEIVAAEPPSRLVSRIADDTLPFGGQWTFVLLGA